MPVYCMPMHVLLYCCIYFATISGLFRCCLLCYHILMVLMIIWDFGLSMLILYMFLERVWCMSNATVDVGTDVATYLYYSVMRIYFSQDYLYLVSAWWCSLIILELVCCCCCTCMLVLILQYLIWFESSLNLSIFACTCSLLISYIMLRNMSMCDLDRSTSLHAS